MLISMAIAPKECRAARPLNIETLVTRGPDPRCWRGALGIHRKNRAGGRAQNVICDRAESGTHLTHSTPRSDDHDIGVEIGGQLHQLRPNTALDEVREDSGMTAPGGAESALSNAMQSLVEPQVGGLAIGRVEDGAVRRHHMDEVHVATGCLVRQPERRSDTSLRGFGKIDSHDNHGSPGTRFTRR